jgi:hypothetical protein
VLDGRIGARRPVATGSVATRSAPTVHFGHPAEAWVTQAAHNLIMDLPASKSAPLDESAVRVGVKLFRRKSFLAASLPSATRR